MLRNVVCFQVTYNMISFTGTCYFFCSENLNMFLMVTTMLYIYATNRHWWL